MKPESIIEKSILEKSVTGTKNPEKQEAKAAGSKKGELVAWLVTVALIIGTWVAGYYLENSDIEPYLHQAMVTADRIEKNSSGSYTVYNGDQVSGYIGLGEGTGYGGPMNLVVATDLQCNITGLAVVRHRETPSWFKRVQENDFSSHLIGKSYNDQFALGSDVDGVSGATYTSRGLAQAASQGSRFLAEHNLGLSVPQKAPAGIQFGLPEGILLALFAVGLLGRSKKFRYRSQLRWFSMLTGMVVLGFLYTNPLTISLINKFVLGYWPDWHTHLYWYLLVGGILFSLTATSKNPYCEWFCPFGAAQECFGTIGGAKNYQMPRYKSFFKWLQRGLALMAILIALMYRNPGISSYEIFGTLFDLKGTIPQFFLLGLVILAALFVHRPWCRYLCPLKPLEAFIRFCKIWMKKLWTSKKQDKAAA